MTRNLVSVSKCEGDITYDDQSKVDALVLQTILQGFANPEITELIKELPAKPIILIKPNWVLHKPFRNGNLDCLITNKSILKGVIKLIRVFEPSSVIIGDSPIQYCDFNSIVTDKFVAELQDLIDVKLEFVDFRRFTLARKEEISSGLIENRSVSNYVKFDLKQQSLLEQISSNANKFQITNYDSRELEKHHRKGKHEYLICNEVFNSDLIINLPKLKMHRLAGYTGALKNFVGCVGDKTYLPHYRFGGVSIGGDSFPGFHLFKLMADLCVSRRNQVIPNQDSFARWDKLYRIFLQIDLLLSRSLDKNYRQVQFGAWSGNDTVWRTVQDIFRIIEYGDKNGTIHHDKQREIWSLTDALICGEGNGPLNPTPHHLGLLTFSTSAVALDIFHGFLFGFRPQEVKFLEHIVKMIGPDEIKIMFEKKTYSFQEIMELLPVNMKRPNNWENA